MLITETVHMKLEIRKATDVGIALSSGSVKMSASICVRLGGLAVHLAN